jgi:pimeloyl-ACP methyl ester carboxylesterase
LQQRLRKEAVSLFFRKEMKAFIKYKNYHWEYETFGSGNALMLAFHGFDRPASDFKIFASSFGTEFKIISIHLFYHGQSSNPNPLVNFGLDDLKGLIENILEEEKGTSFSLMGYSLGGKIALACIQLFPSLIKNAYLFAPDGISIKAYYKFLCRTAAGRSLLDFSVRHPQAILNILNAGQKIGWISEKRLKFARFHLEDKARMKKVANIWLIFRNILPDIPLIQKYINECHINIHLFLGRYDAIIPPALGIYFAEELNNPEALHLLDMGHNLITEKTNQILLELMPVIVEKK